MSATSLTGTDVPMCSNRGWVAVLGKKDTPTDGVDDYCTFLSRALGERKLELRKAMINWPEDGWLRSLIRLWRESADWKTSWILIQYTALSWSRRGFPIAAVFLPLLLHRRGTRCAVVFHEFRCQSGTARFIDVGRALIQNRVIRALYRSADRAVFTVPLEQVSWLPTQRQKAAFIPIGGNIPENLERRIPPAFRAEKTVIVFGVTGGNETSIEVEEISFVIGALSKIVPKLRLVVVGRGAISAQEYLKRALNDYDMELVVRGVLPAEEIADEFRRADVLLFVRGSITPQRGSAMAGIASGVPIVAYRDGKVSDPLSKAGIESAEFRNRAELIEKLSRVLTDSSLWTELHERSLFVQQNYLSWKRIAERYQEVLSG